MEQNRKKLPARRPLISINFEHEGQFYIMGVGFNEGKVAEIFLSMNGKQGSTTDTLACDAAVAVSIALQFGADLDTIRTAMKRNKDGSPQSFIGYALDIAARDFDKSPDDGNALPVPVEICPFSAS